MSVDSAVPRVQWKVSGRKECLDLSGQRRMLFKPEGSASTAGTSGDAWRCCRGHEASCPWQSARL
ncbi:MAG: hypothetical protein Q7T96_18060 [Methylobacter sp.]|nr:hypothetical protein [Methylobacter sp.]